MAKKKPVDTTEQETEQSLSRFRITRAKVKAMYDDDQGLLRSLNMAKNASSRINAIDYANLEQAYFNLSSLDNQRQYSSEAYAFYPIYKQMIDMRANMFQYKYIFTPRAVKEKAKSTNYAEMYALMSNVVDGISIETVFPNILTELFIYGGVYLYADKDTPSQTVRTITLPQKYCRREAVTQYGTYTYQFHFKYFDDLGVPKEKLDLLFAQFPKEFRTKYDAYKANPRDMEWQTLDPRYAAAIQENEFGFPTQLRALFSIKQYDTYLSNELTRNTQTLEKIITHKMPTWEDKLVVDIDEMTALHQSIAKVLSKNKYARLITTFGDVDVKSIGEDQTKENKTLTNAYNAIYDNSAANNNLFSGGTDLALETSLTRTESIVFGIITQLINFYNIAVNNLFNFGGYQCNIEMLPITHYNYADRIEVYRQSATLGVGKLEFIVASGIKQSHIADKFILEDYLRLDQLRPLSTSYTQGDSVEKNREADAEEESTDVSTSTEEQESETAVEVEGTEQEVTDNGEENTN